MNIAVYQDWENSDVCFQRKQEPRVPVASQHAVPSGSEVVKTARLSGFPEWISLTVLNTARCGVSSILDDLGSGLARIGEILRVASAIE